MMKSILIITTCLFGLINNSYAQRIKAELEPSDFSEINEISPFTYSISLENVSEDTFFYDYYADIYVTLSFFDETKKEWVTTDILEGRYENYCHTHCTVAIPRAPKFILPKSKLVLERKNVLCKVSNIKSSDYTPIKIKPKTKVKATVSFTGSQNINSITTEAKIKINPLSSTDQDCVAWLKQQETPYYLFIGEIWDMNANNWISYLHNEKNKESLITLDNYIIEHFPTSSFAPWAKLHRVSYINSYGKTNRFAFMNQNIKAMEEIVAMPLSNLSLSQCEMLFRALFSRVSELYRLTKYVEPTDSKSMDDGDWFAEDLENFNKIENINKKLGAKYNELGNIH